MNKIEYIPHYLIVDIYPDSVEDEPFIIIRVLDGTKWKSYVVVNLINNLKTIL